MRALPKRMSLMEFGNKMCKVTKLAKAIGDKSKKEKYEKASSGIWDNC